MDGERYFASLTVPARVESIRACAAFLVQAARSLKVPAAGEPTFELAIVEALTNAFKHGRGANGGSIVCELEQEGRSLVVRILDAGGGFTLPPSAPVGTPARDVTRIPASGYGLPVIRSVFPRLRTVRRGGRFGLELPLEF